MSNLTPQQEKFAQLVASGETYADAYRESYKVNAKTKIESIWQSSSRIMSDIKVQSRVKELQDENKKRNQVTLDEVIKELKKIKGNMQFIFATHNANIPVLGDSEKVVSCSYDEKKITVHSGTIDNHQTQRFIVDIMEGGDEAFNRRKNIYSIWNIEKIKSI